MTDREKLHNALDDLARDFEIYKDKFQGLEELCSAFETNSKVLKSGNEAYKLLLKQLKTLAYGYENYKELSLNKEKTLDKLLNKLEGLNL